MLLDWAALEMGQDRPQEAAAATLRGCQLLPASCGLWQRRLALLAQAAACSVYVLVLACPGGCCLASLPPSSQAVDTFMSKRRVNIVHIDVWKQKLHSRLCDIIALHQLIVGMLAEFDVLHVHQHSGHG